MRAVQFFDGSGVRPGVLQVRGGRVTLREGQAPRGTPVLDGMVTGLFTDHHVHLQLVDHRRLSGSRLGRVTDLGADPEWARDIAAQNSGEPGSDEGEPADLGPGGAVSPEFWPTIQYAGPFLTAPGGYPSDRAWAPAGAVREISDAAHAAAIVDELAALGVSLIKAVAHSEAGPTLDDDTFRAVVRRAAAHRLPVIAHAEGPGQAQRAVHLGASRLAHAAFSERLSDAEVAAQAASASWISTLTIHDSAARAIAVDNVRRFVAAGGEVLYGTDMGNGEIPVDLHAAEIDALRAAGIDGLDLLASLSPADPLAAGPLLLLPDGDPNRAHRLSPADIDADILEP